jgi:tetratricopeptide (TPR) repeat protein/TolB-like protein
MSSNDPNDRLDSWKAIAGYLRRTERTARRWERHEGLPIHRLSHHDRSSVYAFKSELDAWRTTRSTEIPTDEADIPRRSSQHLTLVLVASLVAGVAAFGGYLWWRASSPPSAGVPTLAVLPFSTDSADAETEHLGGAVARSLVDQIARAPELRVRPFASSARNYREEEEPATIGKRMGVDMVVAGQVEARGEDLTIKVALVDVAANMQVWDSSFSTTYGELGRLQEQMARSLWEEASRRRRGAGHPLPAFDATERLSANPEAVRHYLRGFGYWRNSSRSTIKHSIDQFRRAVELDPDFAAAHGLLAVAYVDFFDRGDLPAVETMGLAKVHARKAIALDPNSANGHTALAAVSHFHDFNHEIAEQQFRAAIAAVPGDARARLWYAEFLLDMRRFNEALESVRHAADRDPSWLSTDVIRGNVLLYRGDPEQAVAVYRQTLEIDPNNGMAHYQLAQACLAMRRYSEAIAALERAIEIMGPTPFAMAALAYGLARAGRRAEANEMLRDFERRREESYYPAFAIAMAQAGLGNSELALEWLEHAANERSMGHYMPNVEPEWEALRDNPRFRQVLQRLGLPDGRGGI